MSEQVRLTLVGEDALCCALGTSLVGQALPGWSIALPIEAGGITKLVPDLPRYARAARLGAPVLCIADTDQDCPVALATTWLTPKNRHPRVMLRLAVREAESWLLADHEGMVAYFKTPASKLPSQADALPDPKRDLLQLLHRYAPAAIKREMVVQTKHGELKRGSGYNTHLGEFARHCWRAHRARPRSDSLARAMTRLAQWPAAVLPAPA